MKRYGSAVIALLMAVSASAFTNGGKLNLFWYHRTGVDTYVADGQGTDPDTPCSGSGQICAKGFSSQKDPSTIKDNTLANQQRVKSN